jgi:hypothetical protein
MTSKCFQKFSLSAAAMLSALAFPVALCAQTSSITNAVIQATAAAKAPVTKPKPLPHRRKLLPDAVSAPAQTPDQSADSVPVQPVAPAASPAQTAAQSTQAANASVQPVVSATPNPTRTAPTDPVNQVQNGIQQVNAKKQKAKSIWGQLKNIKR